MPLVLTQNEATTSGHTYDDRIGVSYEYPASRYRKLISTGDRFVYYRGRRTLSGHSLPQAYLGVGIVGPIRHSNTADRLVCNVLDYEPFPVSLPFRALDGQHLEPGGIKGGFYYQPGVRQISEEVFSSIVQRGFETGQHVVEPSSEESARAGGAYAKATLRVAVEEFAIAVALARVTATYGGLAVEEQSHSNPGFDIRVGPAGAPLRFVEVKGTMLQMPTFFITEGERYFSEVHAGRYTLMVIFSIDLAAHSYRVSEWNGPVSAELFNLSPLQWRGQTPPQLDPQ